MRRLLPLLFALGCAPPVVSLKAPVVPPSARDYGRIHDRYTRLGRAISPQEMDTELLAAATLRAPEFQQAYAARYLKLYRVEDPAAKQRFLQEEQKRADEGLGFLVRTAGHNYNWTDLAPHKGYWRVTLVDEGGEEFAPDKVEPVRAAREAVEAELFGGPLVGPFSRFFYLTFPKRRAGGEPLVREGARRITLRFSGPKGRTDLSWILTP